MEHIGASLLMDQLLDMIECELVSPLVEQRVSSSARCVELKVLSRAHCVEHLVCSQSTPCFHVGRLHTL